jgi:hypothetical protein
MKFRVPVLLTLLIAALVAPAAAAAASGDRLLSGGTPGVNGVTFSATINTIRPNITAAVFTFQGVVVPTKRESERPRVNFTLITVSGGSNGANALDANCRVKRGFTATTLIAANSRVTGITAGTVTMTSGTPNYRLSRPRIGYWLSTNLWTTYAIAQPSSSVAAPACTVVTLAP